MRTRFDALTITGLAAGVVTLAALLTAAGWLIVHRPADVAVAHRPGEERMAQTTAAPPPAPTFSLAPVFRFDGPHYLTQRTSRRQRRVRPAPSEFEALIRDAAVRHRLAPELVAAVARVESDFDPSTLSHKGARGIMQVMPETGKRFGIRHPDELFDPAQNIAAGTAYLAWLMSRYDGNLDLVLAAYNAGEGAVDRYRGIPPYRETQNYVRKVRAALQ
ncbi:MAG TPA: lytic transglycosylase domain-containing protein [Thermoanaerobaculia bacterium]